MSLVIASTSAPLIGANFNSSLTYSAAQIAKLGAFTTGDIIVAVLPAGAVVLRTHVKHSAAIVGASISASTARLVTSNNNYGAGTLDVFAAPGNTAGTHYIRDYTPKGENYASTTNLVLRITSTGANLSVVTAGSITVAFDYTVLK